ncbi:MAG: ABC transporter ATP-binding protein/permease [Lentisphaeraceae bacterium]|nr:ABC transporter ATP-binding protein/permease [Lentisphaeraceae bacterium]
MYPNARRFLKEYLPSKGKGYALGIFCLIITILTTTSFPLFVDDAINLLSSADSKLTPEQNNELKSLSFIILGLGILGCIARVLSRIFIFKEGRKIESEVRQDLFNSVVNMPMEVLSKYKSGDLISRGTNDVTSVRVMISMGILHPINTTLTLIICPYYMYQISPRLTLYCLVPIPVIVFIMRILSKKMMQVGRENQKVLGVLSETIREQFKAHTLLTIFPVFNLLISKFEGDNDKYRKTSETLLTIRVLMMILMLSILSIGFFILLHFGGPEAIENEKLGRDGFNIGSFTAFSLFLWMLLGPLRAIGFLFPLFQRGEICLTRIYQVRDAANQTINEDKSRAVQKTNQLNFSTNSPLVSINDLKFSYPEQANNFSLEIDNLLIKENKKYGIFGPTGCGKTTLFNLICGNLRATGLSLKGTKYEDIATNALNEVFSIVPQENRHFSKTISENIELVTKSNEEGFGTKTEFEDAYKISQLQSDIDMFKDGIDTLLGEHGINLSGGQKQRLSILRALVKKRKALLMDDFVSAVDHKTENAIISGLYSILKKETMILISHRISALVECDEIIIMDQGKIVCQGTHKELLEKNESYRATFEHQTLEKNAGDHS